MNRMHDWLIPIFVTCLVHAAIVMLPVNFEKKAEQVQEAAITFRLVSLSQAAPSPFIEQSLFPPEKKPSPPKENYQDKTTSSLPKSPKAISRTSGKDKEKTALPRPPSDQDSDIAANVSTAEQAVAGFATQMPSGPVMLPSELSVICPVKHAPSYPLLSRRLGEHGNLMLKLELDGSGRVKKAHVTKSSGYHRLDEAAITAVKTWRCNPRLQNGQPVPVIALQPFGFVLQE